MNKVRILIVDDHTLVREGLGALMETIPDFEVVGQAADGYAAVQFARELNPDVILLDLVMPGMDGLRAIREVLAVQPEMRILVITSYPEDERVIQAVKAGASGFLLKDCSSHDLVQAIRNVHQGDAHLQPAIAKKILRNFGQSSRSQFGPKPLTRREKAVLNLVAKGLSNKEIADHLYLSERTVDAHVSHILKKLELDNRTQAALTALQKGWLDQAM